MGAGRIYKERKMKKIYAHILYTVLGAEVIMFTGFFIAGPQGLRTLVDMHSQQITILEGVQQLDLEVASLQQEIDNWHKHPFDKEKVAREQLQMARPDDEVFYLT